MLVKITDMGTGFRASIMAEQYAISIETARALKLGEEVDIDEVKAEKMIADEVVQECD